MEKESTEMFRIGFEAALTTVLMAGILVVSLVGRYWFGRERLYEDSKLDIQQKADAYILESGIEISGCDIVEFILKHDTLYDYYIQIGSNTYEISKDRAHKLSISGKNGGLIWSQAYLADTVFKSRIYEPFISIPERENDETIAYRFILKE